MTPPHTSYEELEELFWKELLNDKSLPPIYGADVCDSITDKVSRHSLFWKELLNDKSLPPVYGADVCDSITDKISRGSFFWCVAEVPLSIRGSP